MPPKHVQAQKHVHGLILKDGKGRWEMAACDFKCIHMYSPYNFLRANSYSYTVEAPINESSDATALRTSNTHNGHLSTRVYKGLNRHPVDLYIHIQHDHRAKTFGHVLDRFLAQGFDIFLRYLLLRVNACMQV